MADQTTGSTDNTNGATGQTQATDNTQTATGEQSQATVQTNETANQNSTLLGATTSTNNATTTTDTTAQTTAQVQTAPENYTDYTMPEGIKVDPMLISKFNPIFKECNLTQDQAQKLVSAQAEEIAAYQKNMQSTFDGWKAESQKLLGSTPEKSLALTAKVFDSFDGGKDVRTLLEQTHLGDHPTMVKFFKALGESMVEDNFVPGSSAGQQSQKSPAKIMYPTMKTE